MLKDTLNEDLKKAMLDKDMVAKAAIQMIKAAILLWEKDEKNIGKEVTDDVIIEIVSKELKKRKDSLGDFEKSGRADLIADLNREIEILQKYLPEQLSEEELTKIVEDAIKEVGADSIKQMGQVMKLVTPKVVGRADNKLVSEMIKSKLN
ncbi:MAG: GatB/YqeY domain-containing protein [Clostridia bacterium]|nr:GatB/YqeY domain-containing protein [Clostridia bacterium]